MKILRLMNIFLAGAMSFASCAEKNNQESGQPPEEHIAEHANRTALSEEQIKNIGIQTGKIEHKQLTSSLKTNGVLKVPNQNKAGVNSLYSGVIKSLLVQPGNFVKKGQAIATIANPAFLQTQSEYLHVAVKIGLAELEVKRQQELNAGNAGALKNLQNAETTLETLRSANAALSQQLTMMGINPKSITNNKLVSTLTVTSPISGVISNVMVRMGSYVEVTTVIAEIVDNSRLHLDIFVFEKDLPKLKNHQTIHFTITNDPGKEYDAEIFSLGSSFEGESKAVTVHALVKGNKSGLIDGMTVTAAISLGKATAPAVPSESIITVEGQDYVFLEVNDLPDSSRKERIFERIPVARGATDIGYTEITPLVKVSEEASIVTKGAFFVSAKMTNTGEHEH